jgi:HTH-type transcriptional regulator, glycine betaine synthesis regulator
MSRAMADPSANEARQRAIDLAAETMGELIAFWGFKASMGRIWTLLYLSPDPLPADVIGERTQLSAGAVSMALAELQQWGIVDRAVHPGDRKRHFRAETDVWGIVRRIVRDRELRLVGRSVQRFTEAVRLLEESLARHPDDDEAKFMLGRLRGLLGLAQIGYRMVESFAEAGMFTLDPIRNVLGRDAGTGGDGR